MTNARRPLTRSTIAATILPIAPSHAEEAEGSIKHAGPAAPPPPRPGPGEFPLETDGDQVSQNIAAVLEFYEREEQKISGSQRILERLSEFVGRPVFLGVTLIFVVLWIAGNVGMRQLGRAEPDPAPFFWLQGIIGLGAMLIATAVLAKQNRLTRLADQRAHLDLKVALLTEQKAAKLIHLLEELRRDLPNVKNRHDSDAVALQQSMNPDLVLAALDERSESDGQVKSAAKVARNVGGSP
jgi:uncharacterized membrane protein